MRLLANSLHAFVVWRLTTHPPADGGVFPRGGRSVYSRQCAPCNHGPLASHPYYAGCGAICWGFAGSGCVSTRMAKTAIIVIYPCVATVRQHLSGFLGYLGKPKCFARSAGVTISQCIARDFNLFLRKGDNVVPYTRYPHGTRVINAWSTIYLLCTRTPYSV